MPFFKEEEMQKIRFLHFSIKKLEEKIKNNEHFTIDDLNNVLEYSKMLNTNFGTYNHARIIDELDISKEYIDILANKTIPVVDLYFECARALMILGQGYDALAQRREEEEFIEDATIAMYESSKIYKTAAYFSAASINQRWRGEALQPLNLELKSEEARLFAQSLVAANEESQGNLRFAAKLYSGLSALSKRIFYLKQHDEIKKHQLRAQMHFDMGTACKMTVDAVDAEDESDPRLIRYKQKAFFYFSKAKEIWEGMVKNLSDLSKREVQNIKINLSVVNDILKELNMKEIPYEIIKKIQDPEPIIVIPENLAPFVPKATIFLSKIVPKDLNVSRFNKFKDKKIEKKTSYSDAELLESQKFGIERTLIELKKMRKDNDITVDEYTEQYEKYSQKLNEIVTKIENLK